MECRRGPGRPLKTPKDERRQCQSLPDFLLHPIPKKSRTKITTTRAEDSVPTVSDAGERTRPEGTVECWWGCDRPRKGPNGECVQPLPDFQPIPSINLQPVLVVGERELLEDTVGHRCSRGRPRKRPNEEIVRPLTCVTSQSITKKPRTNARWVLAKERVSINIPESVEERTPPSNARNPKASSHQYAINTTPRATTECRRGRGRPRKIPNVSLRPLSCSLWEPTTKKARTDTLMVLSKEAVTIDLPKLVEERTPLTNAQKTEELPHWSGTSIAQVFDVVERKPSDDPKAEELPNCIDREERNDKERARELNLPHLYPESKEVPEDSSRPWMWDVKIPGPIPPDVFELSWQGGLLSNFWCGVPDL